MRIVICGAGQVGYGIAERLAAERHDVSIVDTSPDLVRAVREGLDVRGIVGNGAHPEILAQAGAEDADMIIAVTLHDEVNMIACQVAHSLFEVPTKIARIRSQAYLQPHYQNLFSDDELPIDVVISPEIEVAEMVLRRIALPGAHDAIRLSSENVVMVAVECLEDCPILDTPLQELSDLFPDLAATIVGIYRQGQLTVLHATDELKAGDLAYVVAEKSQVRRTLDLFGQERPEVRRLVVAGGGNIGLYVAQEMERRGNRTKLRIIEANPARAQRIADLLGRTVVLAGSALDQKVLREADIDEADLMVALTNDDQVNVLSSVLAKRMGCRSSMALMNDPTFEIFTRPLGIDAYLNPRTVTISRVLQHVRRGRIRAVHSVQNGEAEVIEAEALETSPLVSGPLEALNLPEGLRIGAVVRDGVFMRPTGETRIRPKDRVIIFATAEAVRNVEQLFRVSLEFF